MSEYNCLRYYSFHSSSYFTYSSVLRMPLLNKRYVRFSRISLKLPTNKHLSMLYINQLSTYKHIWSGQLLNIRIGHKIHNEFYDYLLASLGDSKGPKGLTLDAWKKISPGVPLISLNYDSMADCKRVRIYGLYCEPSAILEYLHSANVLKPKYFIWNTDSICCKVKIKLEILTRLGLEIEQRFQNATEPKIFSLDVWCESFGSDLHTSKTLENTTTKECLHVVISKEGDWFSWNRRPRSTDLTK
uniref:Uncharacterized protein n=1 Tax=Ditylenchus dipsaci TaxID=166011 RepID=A0A915EFQ2_9BILA